MRQAAVDLGVTRQRVHQLILEGQLKAVRASRSPGAADCAENHGRKLRPDAWLVSAESVQAYRHRRSLARPGARKR